MRITTAWIAAVSLLAAACGGSPEGDATTPAGSPGVTGSIGAADPALTFAGTYTGTVTLPRGRFTYTWPAIVTADGAGPGLLHLSVGDLRASVDAVDIAPPDTLVIVVAPPGDRSFQLPDGERVMLGSFEVRFREDGRTLEITLSGMIGEEALEWIFVGTR